MDDWWKQIEKTAADVEEFWIEVEETTESLVDEISENVGSFWKQFQSEIVEEVDSLIKDIVEVLIITSEEIDSVIDEDWDNFTDGDFTSVTYHTPSVQSNPACINCANYHGQSYNGNLLVCAMHPEGWDDNNCPDWEEDK